MNAHAKKKSLASVFKTPPIRNPFNTELTPELRKRNLLIIMLVENLGRGELKVLLRNVYAPLAEGVHARLGAHALELSTRAPVHFLGNLCEVDAAGEIHLPAMDAQNISAGLNARRRELNLAVDAARTEKSGIENIETVRRHDNFDVLGGLEAVELVEELQHCALDF